MGSLEEITIFIRHNINGGNNFHNTSENFAKNAGKYDRQREKIPLNWALIYTF